MFILVEYSEGRSKKIGSILATQSILNSLKVAYAKINYVKDTLDRLESPLFRKGKELKNKASKFLLQYCCSTRTVIHG